MADATIDNQALLRKTLVTMAAMVGACVVIVGGLTLVAVTIVGHAVSPPSATEPSAGGKSLVPASNVHGTVGGARPQVPLGTAAK
jgi:hypothetical protein